MSFITKIFGDPGEKYLKGLQPIVEKINSFEPRFEKLSDENLKEKTSEFKERLKKGEMLDDILPEAFSSVREAAKRTLNQRHFDVQLIGGIVLSRGRIAEMKTGEGKTLSATLPLYLNALSGKGAHLVTVNDYLARRDIVWMGQIYHFLGLSSGCLNHDQSFLYDPAYKKPEEEKDEERDELGGFKVAQDFLRPVSRKEVYFADITYGTNNEFGFDYLRDNMAADQKNLVQRGFNYVVVDEVDSVLIDEARTPLIISAPDTESSKWYVEFARIIPKLELKADYEIDEKMKAVTLTEDGINKTEKILGTDNIYDDRGMKYVHHLENALRAEALFKKDINYVVKGGQIIIVDEFTGRLMPGRRWSGGLHQAVEAKEGVEIQPESKTLATVTFQNYFRMYEKLSGMTGTAATSAEEFSKVYELEVAIIPTNLPMIREDLPDRIYRNEKAKFKAIIEEIKERNKKGQPVLVGTTSIEKNEYLGKLLQREGILHQILNAKHHEKEGEIIAQAGRLAAVTIATNMAGRGVDIVLGGNPPDKKNAEEVKKLGGFCIIGTERHESRRVDNQLRGRTGRQGDPGSSQFFISLEDNVVRIFGGENIKSILDKFNLPEDMPIENGMISRAIEGAQGKVEGYNFDMRKHLLEYDDVLNKQRMKIYGTRREILKKSQIPNPNDQSNPKSQIPNKSENNLSLYILELVKKQGYSEDDYKKKEQEVGEENMRKIEKAVLLRTSDLLWMEHLENMEVLRDSVRLRAYGQIDPLLAYRSEGHKMFKDLLLDFEKRTADTIFKVKLAPSAAEQPAYSNRQTTNGPQHPIVAGAKPLASGQKKVGRNDPCPCGSGKKYKKCCWPKYG